MIYFTRKISQIAGTTQCKILLRVSIHNAISPAIAFTVFICINIFYFTVEANTKI